MKRQISEQKWGAAKSKRRSSGTIQPTELYTSERPVARSTTWTNTVRNLDSAKKQGLSLVIDRRDSLNTSDRYLSEVFNL